MELKDFVAQTLTQIVEGVVIAHTAVKDKGATVSPKGMESPKGIIAMHANQNPSAVQMIEFDISLTETEGSEKSGSIGVFISSVVGLGAQNKSETGSGAFNKIRFSIPLVLPSWIHSG